MENKCFVVMAYPNGAESKGVLIGVTTTLLLAEKKVQAYYKYSGLFKGEGNDGLVYYAEPILAGFIRTYYLWRDYKNSDRILCTVAESFVNHKGIL